MKVLPFEKDSSLGVMINKTLEPTVGKTGSQNNIQKEFNERLVLWCPSGVTRTAMRIQKKPCSKLI